MNISFYSYKGGVGRSQLCANTAAFLCYKKGKKVLLWDWDFEAPGMHFFFSKKTEEINNVGTLELFQQYVRVMRTNPNVIQEDLPTIESSHILNLIEYKIGNRIHGKIDLLPAGNYSNDFPLRLSLFDWDEFYNRLDGSVFIEIIKHQIKKLGYDYVLIDSRTGITDYSGICNVQLADANVIVMTANEQNFSGARHVIDKILDSSYIKGGYRKPYILPILSKLDTSHPDVEYWTQKFGESFSFLLPAISKNIDVEMQKILFEEIYLPDTFLEYAPMVSVGENLFFNSRSQKISRLSFAKKYANIGDYIEKLAEEDDVNFYKRVDERTWMEYAEKSESKRVKAIAYINIGIKQNDLELEKPYYEKAIESDKDYFLGWYALGNYYYFKSNYDLAINKYLNSLEINPNHLESLKRTIISYVQIGKANLAIPYYNKLFLIDPSIEIDGIDKELLLLGNLHNLKELNHFFESHIRNELKTGKTKIDKIIENLSLNNPFEH